MTSIKERVLWHVAQAGTPLLCSNSTMSDTRLTLWLKWLLQLPCQDARYEAMSEAQIVDALANDSIVRILASVVGDMSRASRTLAAFEVALAEQNGGEAWVLQKLADGQKPLFYAERDQGFAQQTLIEPVTFAQVAALPQLGDITEHKVYWRTLFHRLASDARKTSYPLAYLGIRLSEILDQMKSKADDLLLALAEAGTLVQITPRPDALGYKVDMAVAERVGEAARQVAASELEQKRASLERARIARQQNKFAEAEAREASAQSHADKATVAEKLAKLTAEANAILKSKAESEAKQQAQAAEAASTIDGLLQSQASTELAQLQSEMELAGRALEQMLSAEQPVRESTKTAQTVQLAMRKADDEVLKSVLEKIATQDTAVATSTVAVPALNGVVRETAVLKKLGDGAGTSLDVSRSASAPGVSFVSRHASTNWGTTDIDEDDSASFLTEGDYEEKEGLELGEEMEEKEEQQGETKGEGEETSPNSIVPQGPSSPKPTAFPAVGRSRSFSDDLLDTGDNEQMLASLAAKFGVDKKQ